MTSSPLSSTTSRSTPWVEGCWGPMLMIITSSWPSAAALAVTSAQSPPPMATTWWTRRSFTETRSAALGRGQLVGLARPHHDLVDQLGKLGLAHVLVQPPLYRLVSGGGTWAPMYSTSTPPSG